MAAAPGPEQETEAQFQVRNEGPIPEAGCKGDLFQTTLLPSLYLVPIPDNAGPFLKACPAWAGRCCPGTGSPDLGPMSRVLPRACMLSHFSRV